MPNLFAYGTLMCEEIMQQVAGCLPPRKLARLDGYKRLEVRGAHYPGIMPDDPSCVQGVLYLDVSDPAWLRLDRFEGEMYVRQTVQVQLPDGSEVTAETYLVRPKFRHALTDRDWDFEQFLQRSKSAFQSQYVGYRSL